MADKNQTLTLDETENDSFIIEFDEDEGMQPPSLDDVEENLVIQESESAENAPETAINEEESSWVDEIIYSEDMEPDEPEADQLDEMLGEAPDEDADLPSSDADLLREANEELAELPPVPQKIQIPEIDLDDEFDLLSPEDDEILSLQDEDSAAQVKNSASVLLKNTNETEEDTDVITSEPVDLDDDDGPIALSDDELDNILADSEEETSSEETSMEPPIELTNDKTYSEPIEVIDESFSELTGEEDDFFNDDAEDQPIALSDDELENISLESQVDDSPSTPTPTTSGTTEEEDIILPAAYTDETSASAITDSEEDSSLPEDSTPIEELSDDSGDSDFFDDADEDGPIALSDDELDNILADADQDSETEINREPTGNTAVETDDSPDPQSAFDETSGNADSDFFDDEEDDGPIALSDDELDNIMADADDEHPVENAGEMFETADPEENENDIHSSGEEADTLQAGIDETDFFTDNEDDGPIALSDDELDNIVADASEEADEDASSESTDFDSIEDISSEQNLDSEKDISAESGSSISEDLEDEGPIALSDDELDNIISDTDDSLAIEQSGEEPPEWETEDQNTEQQAQSTASDDFFTATDDEEDGPIALSDDELDNIISDADNSVAVEQTGEEPPEWETENEDQTELSEGESPSDDFFSQSDDTEDDEPIALSDDELDNIVAEPEVNTQTFEETDTPLSSLAETENTDIEEDIASDDEDEDFFNDSDDDETIALSDDELNNITIEDESALDETAEETDALEEPSTSGSDFFTDSEEEDDDEPIALSDDELDNITTDGEEAIEMSGEEPPEWETESDTTDVENEDDEPVALSNDELDNILGDTDSEENAVEMTGEEPPEWEHETEDADSSPEDFFTDENDEGPIALSDDELDNIIEEAGVEEPLPDQIEDSAIGEDGEELLPPSDLVDETPIELTEPDSSETEEETSKPNQETIDLDLHPAVLKSEAEDLEPAVFEENLESAELEFIDSETPSSEEQTPETEIPPEVSDDSTVEEIAEPQLASAEPESSESAPQAEQTEEVKETPSRTELREMIGYLDNLLGELPDPVIEKFAQSDYFKLYQKVMEKLGL